MSLLNHLGLLVSKMGKQKFQKFIMELKEKKKEFVECLGYLRWQWDKCKGVLVKLYR